ncbi:Zinc finger CCCH domain-containing protein 44 [Forsythia ovata]|uniref:Zinc finger CCCH domain-containing protein 44 n=1 Tax=Forsythia ovata TaxID=205694 RepID=A0ABD1P5C3_9LAMI
MEGEDSGLYRLNVETLLATAGQNQDFHKDNEKLLGVSVPITEDSAPQKPYTVVKPPPQPPVVGQVIGLGQKRKRGRLTKGRKKEEEEEEDVCFICFDGGSLVLCDRKGCPKAYHPSCIKRDEAFFRSKAKWNCGWHICIVCQKASHYMCYTCTYSLCKGCTKNADYVCVRGNKGFCTICMRTVMLIENKDQMNSESVQVDFDDNSSWEYLFKAYWIYLKEKLSLTLSELTQAKNPCKEVGIMACKHPETDVHHNTHDGKVSISYRSSVHLESSYPKGQLNLQNKKDPLSTESLAISNDIEKLSNTKAVDDPSHDKGKDKSSTGEGTDKPSIDEVVEWASKDLLEFVSHMRNGDTSVLSQFDVQSLLLDYVKRNNLRDARSKSQIICDLRLENLFGKPRVGHIEMLKLLEFHFLIKEDSHNNAFIPAGIVVPVANDMEIDGNSYSSFMTSENRKRKTHIKGEERAPHTKLDVYAAIDVHNINLIYLRRNLMEGLIEDKEKFHDKVVGSIVRIRISSNDQKQDICRLVQVVGTRKTSEAYEIGDRTSDFMLEVLNLDKKETILIDAISNQEFSEDECRRLRQSMRCGLLKQLTVGEIQKKAMALQEVRLNDQLEAEILRLKHLRNRATEKGIKKEYPFNCSYLIF